MQKITPCLWFDDKAEEAAKFYTSIFDDSKVENISYYSEVGPRLAGMVMMVNFKLFGQDFMALNGGPEFKPTPAISFVVDCKTQEEIDKYWDRLSEGGKPMQCGWVQDKYGFSWQITPSILSEIMQGLDEDKAKKVFEVMLKMDKLNIEELKAASKE